MRKNSAVPPSHGGWPAWYDGKNINEVLFCEEFLAAHPMKCIRGRLFTVDGAVEDEAVHAGKVPGAKTVEDVRKFYMDQVPMRKGTGPEDVTKAVLYLIEQTCETGQAVPVTGGQVMLS